MFSGAWTEKERLWESYTLGKVKKRGIFGFLLMRFEKIK